MTSRLKRKLGDLGVDTASTKANETFCLIGTPLPPLEKSKDTGEFVPLWKQEAGTLHAHVRDEKGRRRLHGAFTGGFSAGYFNTVGSQEGWTPSTFVSSRNDRAKKKAARPEDFMDEEDLRELQESRKLVDTTEEMDLTGGTEAELRRKGMDETENENDAITTALQAAILPPARDSAGARILRKMGWKLGQGIGPRVTLRQRRLQDLQATTGRMLTGDDVTLPAEDDEEADKHTYAPRDTPVLVVDRKDNFHGLGYRPGMSLNESLGKGSGTSSSGPNISAGFGLGALNDADEDDLDVYDSGGMQRNKMAYDIESDSEDKILISSRKTKTRPKGPSSITATATETFRDGTVVLSGFVLYDKPVAEDRWFPLPDIPNGWRPDPKRVWSQNGSNKENIEKETGPVPHHKWKSGMSADERGTLLGETPLPSAPKSVFDYMSQKDRERLKNIAANLASGASSGPGTTTPTPTTIRIPHTEPHIASAALRGFQPFTTEPAKQARYTTYLQSQADPGSQLTLPQLPNQRPEEFNKELEEYAKSAQIFKPMSGAMAGRFTSAVVVEHGPKIHEGLHQPSVEEQKAQAEEEERQRQEDKLSPKEHAAKLGMYGPMTREVKPWQPARLLCKRFGVKDPNPDMSSGDDTTATENMSGTEPQDLDTPSASNATGLSQQQIEAATASMWDTSARAGGSSGKRDLANVGLGEDDSQGKDTLTYERPSVDVFKAIFASDDEDSDQEGGDQEVEDAVPEPEPLSTISGPGNESSKISRPSDTANVHDPVDINTFKPTFVPREARGTKGDDNKQSEEKKRKKKEKEKRKAIVSFAMDDVGGDGDGGGDSLEIRPKKKKKKDKSGKDKDKDRDRDKEGEGHRHREKKKPEIEQPPGEDDDDMWVEKATPAGVQAQDLDVNMLPPPDSGPSRVRKRAIDFM